MCLTSFQLATSNVSKDRPPPYFLTWVMCFLSATFPNACHAGYYKFIRKHIKPTHTPNANMADLSDGPGLVARKRG